VQTSRLIGGARSYTAGLFIGTHWATIMVGDEDSCIGNRTYQMEKMAIHV
jgi:hypothetical protein